MARSNERLHRQLVDGTAVEAERGEFCMNPISPRVAGVARHEPPPWGVWIRRLHVPGSDHYHNRLASSNWSQEHGVHSPRHMSLACRPPQDHALGSSWQAWPVFSTYRRPSSSGIAPPSDTPSASPRPSSQGQLDKAAAARPVARPRNSRPGYFSTTRLHRPRVRQHGPIGAFVPPRHAILSTRCLACALRYVTLTVSLDVAHRVVPLCEGGRTCQFQHLTSQSCLALPSVLQYGDVLNSLIMLLGQTREEGSNGRLSSYETPGGERGNGKG